MPFSAARAQSAAAELVRVDRPAASQVFSTSDIVVSNAEQKLSVVAKANWAESMPSLVRLNLSIQNFEANFDNGQKNAPLAIVSYRVTYSNIANRKLLGTFTAKQTRRAESINVSSVVSAIEAANQATMVDIVQWMEGRQSRSGS